MTPATTEALRPTPSEIRAAKANQERMADAVPSGPRDPWQEIREAAHDMSAARAAYSRALSYDQPEEEQESKGLALEEAALAFHRILSEVEVAYIGVRVAQCTACNRLRRMSEPREWDEEIVANGGPRLTHECLHCGSTIAVRPSAHPSTKDGPAGATRRTVGDDAGAVSALVPTNQDSRGAA